MGLLDQVIGSALGGGSRGSGMGGGLGGSLGGGLGGALGGGGGSPIASALMMLLASRMGGQGGGLGGLLGGGMGSGGVGGLGGLVERFQQNGHGDVVNSWVGPGQNRSIAPHELESALGRDTVDGLSQQTGVGREDLLSQLSHLLPGVVDQLTPHGRMPQESETSHW